MSSREIYPNAPLRFVAFEVRVPTIPGFMTPEGALPVYERLKDVLPIIGPPATPFEFAAGEGPQVFAAASSPLRLLDRRRTLSVVIGRSALVVETTDYHQYEEFRETIERLLNAASEVTAISGCTRIGIRYVDEVRVPGVSGLDDWHGYVDESLLGISLLNGSFHPVGYNGQVEYEISDGQRVTFRYGALNGRVVEPSGPLRVEPIENGPFFLIDIDSYWAAPDDAIPEFSVADVLEQTDSLRQPVRDLFERTITEKLRNEVLRRPK